jgi:hypothetical protein
VGAKRGSVVYMSLGQINWVEASEATARLALRKFSSRLRTGEPSRDWFRGGAGGLVSYGPNLPDLFLRAATFVADPIGSGFVARKRWGWCVSLAASSR